MDVAEQVCKHLPRTPETTIPLVDQYCACYRDLFPDVTSYKSFKLLHLGIISHIKRKSFLVDNFSYLLMVDSEFDKRAMPYR